jgi:hypothetical protein
MEESVCRAVIADDGRQTTVSASKVETPSDPALAHDPELLWLTAEIQRCTCACCHTASWGGPGVYFWDLEFQPVWTDSASMWSLSVLSGETHEDFQTLPVEDLERVQNWVESERERRGLAAQ